MVSVEPHLEMNWQLIITSKVRRLALDKPTVFAQSVQERWW